MKKKLGWALLAGVLGGFFFFAGEHGGYKAALISYGVCAAVLAVSFLIAWLIVD